MVGSWKGRGGMNRKRVGYAMLAAPFVVEAIVCAIFLGVKTTAIGCAALAALFLWILAATGLAND
jgi:hypothetical protein